MKEESTEKALQQQHAVKLWKATLWPDFAILRCKFLAISVLAKPLAHKSWRQPHRQPDR